MRFQNLAKVFLMAAGLMFASADVFAQPATGVRAELESIKKEIEELKQVAAQAPTLAQAVQDLSSRLVVLDQQVAKTSDLSDSMPGAIDQLHALQEQVDALQRDLEYLRTSIANIEQPAVSGGGGGVTHEGGMHWATEDGLYNMTLGGYLHTRYEAFLPKKFQSLDSAGFRVRRGRLTVKGKLGGKRLHYAAGLEFTKSSAPLLDYYMDMDYRKELRIRVGQAKVPFTKSFLSSSKNYDFLELNETQDLSRYARDVGVWALGSLWEDRIHYHAGISNGAGRNNTNDNIDTIQALRIEGVVLGDHIKPGFADHKGTEVPALTVGAAFVHDLVRLPELLAGVEVGNRDVDSNGILDNIRVMSMSFDAQFRRKGLELFIEGTWRHERWGTILDADDNGDISTLVKASDKGRRNYLGGTAQASYFVIPHKLLVGGRVSHGRLPLLGLSGRSFAEPPPAQRALQVDALVQFYRDGYRRVGLMYSMLNYNEKDGPDPANDIQHAFILEAQLVL